MRQGKESSTGQVAAGGVQLHDSMPEIESFAALSKDQVASIAKHGVSVTEMNSKFWEFTEIQECCCTYTC